MKRSIDTLSVLFTDTVASTELRRRLGEEGADRIRRRHDACLADAIAANGGTLVKGLGDGVLATFMSTADAVAAAVAMQQAVTLDGVREPDHALAIRVGISVGDVSCEDDDVFGVPVIEASRLCSAASGGEILVADLVRALARGRGGFTFEPMGALELKGLDEPLAACRVAWTPLEDVADTAEHVPFPSLLLAGTATAYIGRQDVVDRLWARWTAARGGDTRTVLLSGEPGIGKTRTSAEVARRAYAEGAVVLYGRCDEELGVPYQPFVEALDWYTTHVAPPHQRLGRLAGELTRLLPELSARAPGLPASVSSDPASEEHRLFEAAASWLVEASRDHGLVLVLDDLHWAAKPTLLLLLHVLRAAAGAEPSPARLLVLATYRDTDIDRAHPLSALMGELRRQPAVERVAMGGLTLDEAIELVETAAAHPLDAGARALAVTVYTETEGNPFFISEVLRHLVETGQVRRLEDRWIVTDPERVSVPQGVRDVVGRRLSRLSDDANAVLSVASAIGRDVELEVLGSVVDRPESVVLDALDDAVRARLLEETAPDRYRFAHALVRTTLYDELSATRRRRLHRRIADVLEKLRPDDLVRLSHHLIEGGPEGGDVSRAVRYTIGAGDQALARRAAAEAELHYRRAIELLEDVGDDTSAAAISAQCGLGEALRDQADPEFRDVLLRAARTALASGETELLARAVLADYRGTASIIGGVDRERVELTEAALAAAGDAPSPMRARLLAHLASETAFGRDAGRPLALADEAQELARGLDDDDLLAWVVVRSGYGLFTPRRAVATAQLLEEVTSIADRSGDPALRAQARYWWAAAMLTLGAPRRTRRLLEDALAITRDGGAPLYEWMLRATLVHHIACEGRTEEAELENLRVLELGQALGALDAQAWWTAIDGPIQWSRGEWFRHTDAFGAASDAYPDSPEWRSAHVWYLAQDGRFDEARAQLARHRDDLRPARLIDRPIILHGLVSLAWAAYYLDEADLAAEVADALRGFEGLWTHYVAGTAGPIRAALGLCAAAAGERDRAVILMEDAIDDVRAQGFVTHATWFRVRLLEILLRQGGPGDDDRTVALAAELRRVSAATGIPRVAEVVDEMLARGR